uniref:Protein kinase domain-containing protein n=1 Tax=Amphiprion percula TaxID=161767 RepID=A0A3P8U874_AMPPE
MQLRREVTNSYYVEKLLGEGGFGVVARCMNVDTEEVVALKMFREYIDKEDAEGEIECLCKLKKLDADTHNVVKFIEHFEYKGRFCLIFEMLDLDLFDFLESRNWRPLNVAEIRPIAQQMLVALEGLKNIGLVHADMKPENIVFVDLCLSEFFKVKLIDFGCAIEVSELAEYDTIQNIGYRAPEVIMGLPLTEAVDMWSLGDVLAYMFLGELLYPTESEYEQLRVMVHMQGQPKDHLLKAGEKARRFFTKSHDSSGQAWRMKTPDEYEQETEKEDTQCLAAGEKFSSIDDMLHHFKKNMDPAEEADTKAFLSLLKQMLHMDPKKRITPSAALRHPFITMEHLFVNTRFSIQYREQALLLMARCDPRVADMGDIFTSSKVLSSNKASTSGDDTEGLTEASLDQGGTKDQIIAVTHQEEKMSELTAPLENPSVSDGVTKDKRITAASLNIREDRPPQEVTVTNIEPAKNIMDKTNQNMQEDPSDVIKVTTKKKRCRRFRKFLSRVFKCFTCCCRGVDDD